MNGPLQSDSMGLLAQQVQAHCQEKGELKGTGLGRCILSLLFPASVYPVWLSCVLRQEGPIRAGLLPQEATLTGAYCVYCERVVTV